MDRKNYRNNFINILAFCVYSIGSSAYAQSSPQNTNIAGPSASATGNVTNQAVQVLQGPFPMNTYGAGVSCTGGSLTFSPFIMGNLNGNKDPSTYQTHGTNAGVAASFSIPLDSESTELCKARAKAEINRVNAETDKARLDFELVRLLRCGEAARLGVRFHPESPYASICSDIVIVNSQ